MHTIETLKNSLHRLGDQEEVYTEEEDQAIQQFFDLVAADEDLQSFWETVLGKIFPKNLIIVILRLCNMDVQLLYNTGKTLFTLAIKTYPDLLLRVNPDKMKSIADKRMFQTLHRPVDQGPAVILFKISKWKPSEFNVEELVVYVILYYLTVAKTSAEMQRQGIIGIGDMSGLKLEHIRHVTTIDLLSKIATVLTKLPTQMIKGAVVYNCFSLFTRAFNMFKWILPENMRKIIHITGKDLSQIKSLIPQNRLPVGLGGTVLDAVAYNDGIEKDIFSDPHIIHLAKHMKNEVLIFNGCKQR